MMPSFSIITATYNARETVAETMRSIASQAYPRMEHIVQDGGSADGTLAEINRHLSDIVTVLSAPDLGVYDAFNKGLARASGDIVAFIGADDQYEGERVLEEVAEIFSDPSIDMVFGDALLVTRDDPSKVVRYYQSSSFSGLGSLTRGFMPAHTATFVRRAVYDRVGSFDTSYRIAGDFEWLVRAFHNSPPNFVHIPKPLVRMRTGGLSSRGIKSTWKITAEFQRACRSNGVRSGYARLLARLPRKALELVYGRLFALHDPRS